MTGTSKRDALITCFTSYLVAGKVRDFEDAKEAARIIKERTEDLPESYVAKAILTWLDEHPWPPTVADIRRLTRELMERDGYVPPDVWRARLSAWKSSLETGVRFWPEAWGPAPDTGRCKAPEHIMKEVGL